MKALSLVIAIQLILLAVGSEWELEADSLIEEESFDGFENIDDESLVHFYEYSKAEPFYSLTLDILRNLRYRLDVVPCTTRMPDENQGLIYYTRVYYSSCRKSYKCIKKLQLSRDYEYSDNTIVITPQTTEQGFYEKRALERHHIAGCPSGHFCEFKITIMDLQPAAIVNEKTICLDYLEIVEENTNNQYQFCGNETRDNTRFTHNLQITFRSGFSNEGKGFKILITKTQKVMTNMEEGCLEESRDVSVEDYMKYFSARSNARDGYEQNERSRSDKNNEREKMERNFEAGIDKNDNEGNIRFMESYQDGERPNFDKDENTNNNWEEMKYRDDIKLMEAELERQRPDESRENGEMGDDENNQMEEGMRRGYEGETREMEGRYRDYSRRPNSRNEYEPEGDFNNENDQWGRRYRGDDYERQRDKREGRFIEDDKKDDMERNNLIPRGTKQKLYQYYLGNQMTKVFGRKTNGDARVLKLATTSLKSCDKTLVAIADKVLSLLSKNK